MLTLYQRDSRRLTGPSRHWNRASAILDVGAPLAEDPEEAREGIYWRCPPQQLIDCWRGHARQVLDAIGWSQEDLSARIFEDGVSLLLSAPIDALYAATEVNEFAFECAIADLIRGPQPDIETGVSRLRQLIAAESNPALLNLARFADHEGVLFLSDDDQASLGSGRGSHTWPADSLPDASDLAALELSDIKVAAVSGTNGKSTTVRLLAAMIAAERIGTRPAIAGLTSTDWIRVGTEVLDTGDYSGPGGARTVLRHPDVDIAILEAARGGLNRRGLGVPRLDVACLTNIGTDHLGDHGSTRPDDLLDTKWTIARVADHVVLNADDPLLRLRGQTRFQRGDEQLTWTSLDPRDPVVHQHTEAGGSAVALFGEQLMALTGRHHEEIANVRDVHCTLGGTARHNVSNALSAIATARAIGISSSAIVHGLRSFGIDPNDNPGRLTQFLFGVEPGRGPTAHLRVVVDFAHNAEGIDALLQMAENLAPTRVLLSLGQAGDRDDESIQHLAEVAYRYQPSQIVIKELDSYRRGRAPGEVPALIRNRLLELGYPTACIEHTESELETVEQALRWARSGDLLLLVVHSERDRVLDALRTLQAADWTPGSPLPSSVDLKKA